MAGALDGLLVVSVEQAVAAPYCAARLADAGARVIKIERREGDRVVAVTAGRACAGHCLFRRHATPSGAPW